jgi:hypothetical protein
MKKKTALLTDQTEYEEFLRELEAQSVALAETVELVTGAAPSIAAPTLKEGHIFLVENVGAMEKHVENLKGIILQATGRPAAQPVAAAATAAAAPAAVAVPATKAKLTLTEQILAFNGVSTLAELNAKHEAKLAMEAAGPNDKDKKNDDDQADDIKKKRKEGGDDTTDDDKKRKDGKDAAGKKKDGRNRDGHEDDDDEEEKAPTITEQVLAAKGCKTLAELNAKHQGYLNSGADAED